MAGLLDAFKQYISDVMPGGVLNPEGAQVAPAVKRGAEELRQGLLAYGAANRAAIENPTWDNVKRSVDGNMAAAGMAPLGMVAPRAEAMRIAQQNAAKPISEGGLGLRPDNTPMERAMAMGFDTPAYHASMRDFDKFSNDALGANTGAKSATMAHFFAKSPDTPNSYLPQWGMGKNWGTHLDSPPAYAELLNNKEAFARFNAADDAGKWAILEELGLNHGRGRVIPVMLNRGKTLEKDYVGGYRDETYADILKKAKKSKKDSVTFLNTHDPGGEWGSTYLPNSETIYGVFKPENIRSRFAAFDPARRHEADLLGQVRPDFLPWMMGAGLLGGYGVSQYGDAK